MKRACEAYAPEPTLAKAPPTVGADTAEGIDRFLHTGQDHARTLDVHGEQPSIHDVAEGGHPVLGHP